jgi:hypothetical protein
MGHLADESGSGMTVTRGKGSRQGHDVKNHDSCYRVLPCQEQREGWRQLHVVEMEAERTAHS